MCCIGIKHVIGIKCDTGANSKTPGSIAKFFSSNTPTHAYPLFKTHKLSSETLASVDVCDVLMLSTD